MQNKTLKLSMNAMLIAIGALLHTITPALGLPMQPDFALIVLFFIILINKDYKTTLVASIVLGLITAWTTKFPGGQIPNIIDKLVTGHVVFLFFRLTENVKERIKLSIALSVGTAISGLVFLGSAYILVGLPASFSSLLLAVVVPAIIANVVLGNITFKAIKIAMKATKL